MEEGRSDRIAEGAKVVMSSTGGGSERIAAAGLRVRLTASRLRSSHHHPVCPRLSPSDPQLTSPRLLTDKCVSRASTPSGRPAGAGGSEMNPPQDGDIPDEGRACVGQALWIEDRWDSSDSQIHSIAHVIINY